MVLNLASAASAFLHIASGLVAACIVNFFLQRLSFFLLFGILHDITFTLFVCIKWWNMDGHVMLLAESVLQHISPEPFSVFGDDLTLAVNRCVVFSLLRCKHCLALSQITTQLSPPANILASRGVTFSDAHTWNIQLHIKETFPLRALGLCDSLLYYSAHRNYISTAALTAKLTIHR